MYRCSPPLEDRRLRESRTASICRYSVHTVHAHCNLFARAPFIVSVKIRKLVAGQVLMREGDPADAVYIIYAGQLRVYRRDLTTSGSMVDLALLGAGEIIGELGPILGRPRSASVQAIEPSEVLEIPASELLDVVQQHSGLLRVIDTALRDRSDLAATEIDALTAKLGLSLPPEPPVTHAPAASLTCMPVPPHDPAVVYPKSVDCASCGMRFSALSVQPRRDQPAERESDFHNVYRSEHNPYDYEPWVCPNDLYAALPADFPDLADKHRLQVAPVVEGVVAGWETLPEFNAERTFELRERALELTLALYAMRGLPKTRLAAVTHRLAWCARERGDAEAEKTWLARALEHYSAAYSEADLGDVKEDLRVQYLCGELSLRLGDATGAITWFAQALQHPRLKEYASWERMLREQWAIARATTS